MSVRLERDVCSGADHASMWEEEPGLVLFACDRALRGRSGQVNAGGLIPARSLQISRQTDPSARRGTLDGCLPSLPYYRPSSFWPMCAWPITQGLTVTSHYNNTCNYDVMMRRTQDGHPIRGSWGDHGPKGTTSEELEGEGMSIVQCKKYRDQHCGILPTYFSLYGLRCVSLVCGMPQDIRSLPVVDPRVRCSPLLSELPYSTEYAA